jgi:hypothetical protein
MIPDAALQAVIVAAAFQLVVNIKKASTIVEAFYLSFSFTIYKVDLTAPPSTIIVCPVTNLLCLLNNQTASDAKSSASPNAPTGIC